VQGLSTATSGVASYGVAGQSDSSNGTGVYGTAPTYGVRGWASASSGVTYGVHGSSASAADGRGVYGEAPRYGVYGKATASSGNAYGVYGTTDRGFDGYGVYGHNTNTDQGTGVYGEGGSYGVYGKSTSQFGSDAGVYGDGYYGVHGVGTVDGIRGEGPTGVNALGDGTGVYAEGSTYGVDASSDGTAVFGWGSDYGLYGRTDSDSGVGVYGQAESTSGETRGVYGRSSSSSGFGVLAYNSGVTGVALAAYSGGAGDIIQGWAGSPESGPTARRFRVTQGGYVYGTTYYCATDDGGNAAYVEENGGCMHDSSPADFAEVLPVAGEPGPGDVLAVGSDGQLESSSVPYQTTVVGVYSARPSYVGGAANLGKDGYAPLAIVGLVPVNASAENGPIVPGDLLVASATPGHAMTAGPNPPVGTVVGKALEGLEEDTGVIQILVMLQ